MLALSVGKVRKPNLEICCCRPPHWGVKSIHLHDEGGGADWCRNTWKSTFSPLCFDANPSCAISLAPLHWLGLQAYPLPRDPCGTTGRTLRTLALRGATHTGLAALRRVSRSEAGRVFCRGAYPWSALARESMSRTFRKANITASEMIRHSYVPCHSV